MKRESAEKVIKILLSADGGCIFCARELLKLFVNQFPEYKDLAQELFKNTFGTDNDFSGEEKHKVETKHKEISLHGWDDEKIYFWDGEKERCVSDEEELYKHIVKICKEYFEKLRGSKK